MNKPKIGSFRSVGAAINEVSRDAMNFLNRHTAITAAIVAVIFTLFGCYIGNAFANGWPLSFKTWVANWLDPWKTIASVVTAFAGFFIGTAWAQNRARNKDAKVLYSIISHELRVMTATFGSRLKQLNEAENNENPHLEKLKLFEIFQRTLSIPKRYQGIEEMRLTSAFSLVILAKILPSITGRPFFWIGSSSW